MKGKGICVLKGIFIKRGGLYALIILPSNNKDPLAFTLYICNQIQNITWIIFRFTERTKISTIIFNNNKWFFEISWNCYQNSLCFEILKFIYIYMLYV